jgi:hypothetical protein
MRPTGRPDRRPARPACRNRRSAGSGGRSGSSPTLVDTFKLSTDPQFIDKVRDVVEQYLNPPGAAMVLCVDEKSSIQASDRTTPSCRCCQGPRSGRLTTTPATAPPTCTPPGCRLWQGHLPGVGEVDRPMGCDLERESAGVCVDKTANEILDTIATYYQQISDSGH